MTWLRLEGTSIDAELLEATQAQLADPLWLIGKQWQVGELTGDDAATPVLIEADVAYTPISRFQGGPRAAHAPVLDRDRFGVPLETVVEREDVWRGPAGTRLSAEAGLQLLRALGAVGVQAGEQLRTAFPLHLPADDGLDGPGREQLTLLTRRSFDAVALATALDAGHPPQIPALGGPPGSTVLADWRTWQQDLFSVPGGEQASWSTRGMDYRFRVGAHLQGDREVMLDAPGYTGGSLDWYAFDVRPDLPGLGASAARTVRRVTVAAVPARFAGQAASRFWQVEDGEVWFGDLHVGSTDLGSAAIGAYAASYGDDWFTVPVRLPRGVLARVERVTVRDTMGRRLQVRSCAELDGPGRVWRCFELTGDTSADAPDLADRRSPWLFLAPTLPGVVESRPVEEVLFLRDQLANLGWGTELTVESRAGRRVDRAAQARADRAAEPEAADLAWLYRLGTTVLGHQVPLVPVRGPRGELYLQRGRLATASDGGGVQTQGSLGRILEPGRPLLVLDSEVPDIGLRVTRSWQMARTATGAPVCWVGRRTTSAPPRRAPGLLFDDVAP